MKNVKYIQLVRLLVFSFLLIGIWSCDDALDITPPSSVTPEKYLYEESHLAAYTINYYTHESYTATAAAYGGMLSSHVGNSVNSPYYTDITTDNAIGRNGNNRYKPGLMKVSASGGDWNFSNIFSLNFYLNTVVPRFEEGIIAGDAANIKHYVGEGYFLRAHEYFFRLRKIGDFPIITEVLPDNQEILTEASKRSPGNEVARFILSDLDKAIEMLTNNPPGGKARITKNAALLLKARVALFAGTWLKHHAGTAHVPNGPGWPGADKDYNKGYQFPSGSLEGEIDFFLTEAMNASKIIAESVSLVDNNKIIRETASQSKNPYYDMFAGTNPSSYSEVLMYRTYSTSYTSSLYHSYNQSLYYGYSVGYTRQMADAFLMENGLPIYAAGSGYKGDDYIQDTKVDRDWRWRLFMKAPGEIRTFENIAVKDTFPNPAEVDKTDYTRSTSTGYMIGKGQAHNYNMQEKDITASVIFRAAEAYLIYIEACYEKNGTIDSDADKYWRAIRNRAGVDPDFRKTIAATDMSIESQNDWGAYSQGKLVDATLFNIRRERRCEFIGEGFRLDDLYRWRALDRLNGFQLEGCKIWGPMKDLYPAGALITDNPDETKNIISSPSLSTYLRSLQVRKTNNEYYDGFFFTGAHYLEPIAVQHFLITSADKQTVTTSPIYQNPGWPIAAGEGAVK
jgi:SusD family.